MTSQNVAYAAAVLAIYLALLPPTAYVAWKHGTRGQAWLGWGYLVVFCTLKIVGSAMQIAEPTSTGAGIISSIGLSPLTIATGGVLHEARFYLLSLHQRTDEAKKLEHIILALFHIVVMTAIALTAVGASRLASESEQAAGPAKLDKDWHLAGAGALILLLAVLVILAVAVYSYRARSRSVSTSTSSGGKNNIHSSSIIQDRRKHGRHLVVAVGAACPLLLVRLVGSVVYFFGERADMSPAAAASGGLGVRVGLYTVPEVLAALLLVVGGLATRRVARAGV